MSKHEYPVDFDKGVVIGVKGRPFSRRNGRGYIEIRNSGKAVGLAHRYIWERANGPIPAGMQINHINGIKDDNRLCNLELVTASENTKHAYAIGLSRADGEFNGRALLDWEKVAQIRQRANEKHKALAAEFGVSRKAVCDVINHNTWRMPA